jgi:acyl-CoA dehydrogenase
MINLETPKKFGPLVFQARTVATEVFRANSRKYDSGEHSYPKELDMLAAVIDGMNESGALGGAGAGAVGGNGNGATTNGASSTGNSAAASSANRNGSNMASLLGLIELCWGDVGLLLTMPRQGLGQAAIAAVADEQQLKRFGGKWAAMAITEPEAGSDSAAIRTTARLDGDEYVLNGEKIFVTAGDRAELIVVWATLDPEQGRAAIKSFVVERDNPGLKLERLEHKLGIRASDTANFRLEGCRVPKENLLGSPEVEPKQGFAGVMQTFDNTRPLVAGMAIGVARACLERTRELLAEAGTEIDYDAPAHAQSAAACEFISMESDWEAARLLTMRAAWMADNRQPNSLQASMAKAKAGRTGTDIALRCVALCGSVGYGEGELLEKWARDAKILDLFEGTQQIQLLIVARQLLGKTSAELR